MLEEVHAEYVEGQGDHDDDGDERGSQTSLLGKVQSSFHIPRTRINLIDDEEDIKDDREKIMLVGSRQIVGLKDNARFLIFFKF